MNKILISAYACEPDKGSEPGVGWNWIQEIAKSNEIWVFTRENNQQCIEKSLENRSNHNMHFVYVTVPKWISFWKKGQRGVRTYYYLWQFFAFLKARKVHKKVQFDIAHHITFVNDWLWTFLCLMPIPYIWGPIGSHPFTPSKLLSNPKSYLMERIRVIIQTTARLIDPMYWLSAIKAHTVVAINNETANVIPLKWLAKNKTVIESAIGIEPIVSNDPIEHKQYNILFVGRFAAIKAPHIAIDAFADFLNKNNIDAKFTLIGSGPELPQIKKQIKKHGIEEHVEIIEWLKRSEVLTYMSNADVFLFPSMECGGMVVLEAMAFGIPTICLQYGGPGSMVSDSCGIKVTIKNQSKKQITHNLGNALLSLSNFEFRKKMSFACKKRVNEKFLWQHKQAFAETLYKKITLK